MILKVADIICGLLYPSRCAGCGAWLTPLCDRCIAMIEFLPAALWPKDLCPTADSLSVLSRYSFPIREILRDFKYKSILEYAQVCAKLLYYAVPIPSVDLIVPAPTSPDRIRRRGFNQAEEISRELAKILAIECDSILVKSKNMRQHALLGKNERLQDNSVSLLQEKSSLVANKRVLLLDDVITTGATLESCSQVLKAAGAREVHCLVLAHGS